MTADDRLNQLEPLLSEALTVLDRHTYQLKQLSGAVGHLTTAVAQQGDNISFLLREQLAMKGDITEMKGDIVEIKGTITGMNNAITGIEEQQEGMNGKLDQILHLLQQPGK